MTSPQRPAVPRAQDDLFRHVNGEWLEQATIPDDRASVGSFADLDERALADVREILESLDKGEPGERGKLAILYDTFMDQERLDALGVAPLLPLLDRVDDLVDLDSLARHWGWSIRHQIATLMVWYIDADMDQPDRHTLNFWQSGLGLPDRDYYVNEAHASVREKYRGHVERSLALAGAVDAAEQARLVLQLESDIAACHWTKVACRDIQARHNPMPWADFVAMAPGLRLDVVLAAAEVTPDQVERLNVAQPGFFTTVAALVTDDRLPAWRAWARWSLVRTFARYLSSDFSDERFDFYGRTLQGTVEPAPRWKRGVNLVEGVMGEAVGKLYVDAHFPPASKGRMDELVRDLLTAYRDSISALDWMGEQTRTEALHKLDGLRSKIGYPTTWRDYSALEVTDSDLVASLLASARFDMAWSLGKLQRAVDQQEWFLLPQTVNAYYHPLRNEIVFPAAILQPPFFDVDAAAPLNYGGIGSIIGHEIGHGFDDQGSTCDGDGRLRNWWTDEDRAAFTARTAALVQQFDVLTPTQLLDDEPRPHVNGALTIGENIGDLGGATIALKALAIGLGQEPTPEDVRTFFTGYASAWCSLTRPEQERTLLQVDPHSPTEFRCNQIASNLDAFHAAFETGPGDGMWLDPADRISIW